jgi:hypothetical protein
MTKPSEGSKELSEILNDLAQYVNSVTVAGQTYGIFIGGEPVKEAEAKIQAHVKVEIRKTLERLKEQLPKEADMPAHSLRKLDRVKYVKCLTASVNYNQALTDVRSAIDNEIKELEER